MKVAYFPRNDTATVNGAVRCGWPLRRQLVAATNASNAKLTHGVVTNARQRPPPRKLVSALYRSLTIKCSAPDREARIASLTIRLDDTFSELQTDFKRTFQEIGG